MLKRRNFLRDQSIRSYSGDRFRNPYFQKGSPWTKWKILGLIILLFGTIIGGFSFLIFGPWLKITTSKIDGLTTVPQSEVEAMVNQKLAAKRLYFLPNDQRWLFDADELTTELNERFHFSSLTIKIEKDTLSITAEERISAVAWQTGDHYFLLGLNGQPTIELDVLTINTLRTRQQIEPMNINPAVSDRAPLILAPSMPIITDLSAVPLSLETLAIKPEFVQTIIDWDTMIRRGQLQPTSYEIETPGTLWLAMKTTNGPKVLFDLSAPVEEQGRALEVILAQYTDQLSDLKSIDVRFGNNVFVK